MEVLYKVTGRLAEFLAATGGAVLVLAVGLTCISIGGRALVPVGLGPIPGDVELVEIAVGFSVFSFFPWCQYKDSHARVDLLERVLSRTVAWGLQVLSDSLMLLASSLIGLTLFQGMLDKREFGETTFILRIPLWPGYALCLVCAAAAVFISGVCLLRTILERPKNSTGVVA